MLYRNLNTNVMAEKKLSIDVVQFVEKGESVKEYAKKNKITVPTMYNWKKGEIPTAVAVLKKIADKQGLKIDDLITEIE